MALNFPDNPSVNQIYTDTASGFSYVWDGTVWISYESSDLSTVLEIDDISPQFYSDPNILRAVEIDTWSSGNFSGIKYYAQVVLDTSLGIAYNATQYCEFIVTHNNDQVRINQYSDLSDSFDLGEI